MPRSEMMARIGGCIRKNWWDLLVTDIFFKVIGVCVLTPLLGALLQCLLWIAGDSALSDVDIALFFVHPFGIFSGILLAAVWFAIVALEQASLLVVLAASESGKRTSPVDAIWFAVTHIRPILLVASRVAVIALLLILPFIVTAFFVYKALLGEYDINFYLTDKPLQFKVAIFIGIILLLILLAVFVALISRYFLSFPMVLFERRATGTAFRESSRVIGNRRSRVMLWLANWLVLGIILHFAATFTIGFLASNVLPSTVGSITLLAARIGGLLFTLAIVSTLFNVVGTVAFALILFHGYVVLHPEAEARLKETTDLLVRVWALSLAVTRIRIAYAFLIALLGLALWGFWTLDSLQLDDHVQVMAHRGASKRAPENTLASMRQAIVDKADWVEFDVQESADGEVIVVHDSDFMKQARDKLKTWEATRDILKDLDIGSWFDPSFSQERVATLEEVLALCKGKVGVIIELKYYGHDVRLEERVAEIVDRSGVMPHAMIMSLKPEGIKKMKSLRPEWKYGVLLSLAVGEIGQFDCDFLAVNARFATRSLVNRAHRAGKEVYAWTINDPATLSMMINRGVDGILTDEPDVLRRVLKEREEMSSSQRLLLELGSYLGVPPKSVEQ